MSHAWVIERDGSSAGTVTDEAARTEPEVSAAGWASWAWSTIARAP